MSGERRQAARQVRGARSLLDEVARALDVGQIDRRRRGGRLHGRRRHVEAHVIGGGTADLMVGVGCLHVGVGNEVFSQVRAALGAVHPVGNNQGAGEHGGEVRVAIDVVARRRGRGAIQQDRSARVGRGHRAIVAVGLAAELQRPAGLHVGGRAGGQTLVANQRYRRGRRVVVLSLGLVGDVPGREGDWVGADVGDGVGLCVDRQLQGSGDRRVDQAAQGRGLRGVGRRAGRGQLHAL